VKIYILVFTVETTNYFKQNTFCRTLLLNVHYKPYNRVHFILNYNIQFTVADWRTHSIKLNSRYYSLSTLICLLNNLIPYSAFSFHRQTDPHLLSGYEPYIQSLWRAKPIGRFREAVTLWARIRKILGSYFGRNSGYPEYNFSWHISVPQVISATCPE
jgi:hypothetical protein